MENIAVDRLTEYSENDFGFKIVDPIENSDMTNCPSINTFALMKYVSFSNSASLKGMEK